MKLFHTIIATYREAFSGLPRLVWILAGGALVNRAGTMVLPFLSLYLTRDFGLSVERAGVVLAVFGLGAMVGAIVGGRLSDRYGAIRIQLVSLGLSGAGFLVLGQLRTFPTMVAGVFLVSVVSEAFRPAMMAAVALASPTDGRPRAFALIRLAVNLGMALGPAVAGILASISYRWLFVVDGVTCWAAGVVLFAAISPEALRPEMTQEKDEPVVSPWKDGPFLVLLVLVFFMAMAFLQVWITYPIYLREVYGLNERGVGFLMAFNALLIVLFEMVLLHLIEQYDHLKVAGIGAVLICLGLGLLPLGTGIAFAIFLICVWSLGEMLNLPMVNAVVAARAGRRSAGRYMGAYTLSFATAFVVSPLLGTAIYQRLGPSVLWYGIGCSGLLLFVGFQLLARRFR
ncbi:MAG: MFS transporter [Acidobacteria bacterium]|nr:MAG: MFS transporter [Acidobacteriota bacterium]RLE35461.1 MAG: MFS transporter [Acidobacteriota bacterium]